MIKFDNVNKSYNNINVLSNISFNINEGEIFGVIGHSGAGKSTLIRAINKIIKIDSGTIIVDNINVTNCSKEELRTLRQNIGFVFQNFNLLSSLSVYENIALPLKNAKKTKDEINKKVEELLKLVGLSEHKDKYIHQLSGGQKQRVGIARSLSLDPKILLCDESTSALDPTTTKQILSLLEKINKKYNITIVVITHEMEVIRQISDRVLVLSAGEIVDTGFVIELYNNPKSKTTKDFLKVDLELDEIDVETNTSFIIDLKYKSDVDKHLLSTITKKFNVDFSIVDSEVHKTRQGKFGLLRVQFSDHEKEIINYLNDSKINYEVKS